MARGLQGVGGRYPSCGREEFRGRREKTSPVAAKGRVFGILCDEVWMEAEASMEAATSVEAGASMETAPSLKECIPKKTDIPIRPS